MKIQILKLILCFSLVAISCTPVKIYSDPKMTTETGLKFYTVKPFLQVERENESGRILKSVVLYLPDLQNPQYLVIKNRPGSSKTDIKLTDIGTLSTFGYTSDSKIEEYVESMASLLGKGAGAIQDLNALKGPDLFRGNTITVELYEIIMGPDKVSLREVKTEINK